MVMINEGLFDEFFKEHFDMTKVPLNAYQTDVSVVIELYAPNLENDKFKISVNDGVMKIEGGISKDVGEKRQYFYREFVGKEFVRTVVLPKDVDVDGANASYSDGILRIELPKIQKSELKEIIVK